MTLANSQEPAISEGERRGLAACLAKCPDVDMKCNNRCISQFQTRGAWSDRARACIRSCRNGYRGGTETDGGRDIWLLGELRALIEWVPSPGPVWRTARDR
jgi:hypothetical protein